MVIYLAVPGLSHMGSLLSLVHELRHASSLAVACRTWIPNQGWNTGPPPWGARRLSHQRSPRMKILWKWDLGGPLWEKWVGERELLKEGDAGVVDSEERKILRRVGRGRGRGGPRRREIQAKSGCKVRALTRGIWEWASENLGRRRLKGRKFWWKLDSREEGFKRKKTLGEDKEVGSKR